MRQRVFPLMIFSLLLAATGWAAARQGDGAGLVDNGDHRTDEQYTALIQSVPSPPRWFKGTDGRVHLVYELLLTNAFPVPVTVTSVEILDADQGRVVAVLGGAALTASMSLLTGGPPLTELPPSTVAVVWFDLTFADRVSLPAVVTHRVTAAVPPGLGMTESVAVGGRAEVDSRPPVALGPPLLGPRWVAAGSCCDGPHRRALFPLNGRLALSQRFAIDFNRLDAEGRFTVGDPRHNESTVGYGQPVIAVADAVVVAAVDRFPDQTPGDMQAVEFEGISGNQVILDLGEGRFAFYAHLRPGSVAVRTGDRVVRGQRLGELGNSGNSTGPHLHFHVMDRPSPQVADGLPYVFDSFVLTGSTPPIAELMVLDEAQQPVPIDTAGAGPRQNALPLSEDEVTFPVSVAPAASGDFAGLVEIGNGRRMYLECRGQGGPTVVLVSGLGDSADVWNVKSDPEDERPTVFAEVATFTRVCAYNRPSTSTATETGRSTPVPQPTSAKDAAADLDAVLTASGEPGPYLLAGHSYGGPIIRLYASAHPADVVGLVLIDALSEDLPNGLTPTQRALFETINTPPAGTDAEVLDLQATFQQLRESPPAPMVPTVVLTADRPQLTAEVLAAGQLPAGVDQEFADALWAAQLAAQDKLAGMFPDAEHITNTNSTHYIHLDNPQLVTDSIRQIVDAVRE